MCSLPEVHVRGADRGDLGSIARIAQRAIPAAYDHLLSPRTIAAWLESAFTEAAVTRSWEDHEMLVAIDPSSPVAFAGVFDEQERVNIGSLFTDPERRCRGAATALVEAIQESAGGRTVTADVLLGNHVAERFYEHRGFVPGEALSSNLFGEPIVERRWYREQQRG